MGHRYRGFTVVEVLMVVVLMGILFAIALPRFASMRDGMAVDSAAQQLAGDLRRVQVEAIKRNKPLTLARTGASSYAIDSIGARSFGGGVVFDDSSSASVRMAAFGPPVSGAAAFILELDGRQKIVRVNAAGLVSVQ